MDRSLTRGRLIVYPLYELFLWYVRELSKYTPLVFEIGQALYGGSGHDDGNQCITIMRWTEPTEQLKQSREIG